MVLRPAYRNRTDDREYGPQAMDELSQRTVLTFSGLLALAGWTAPLLATGTLRPHATWTLTW